jgi:hypothetical protein
MALLRLGVLYSTVAWCVLAASPLLAQREDLSALQAKLADLKTPAPLPTNEILLYQELNSISTEQAKYRPLASVSGQPAAVTNDINQVRTQTQALFGALPTVKCDASDAAAFVTQAIQVAQRFSMLSFKHDLESSTWEGIIIENGTAQERCAALRAALTAQVQADVLADIDRFVKESADLQSKSQQQADLAKQVVEQLETRKAEIEKKLRELAGQEHVKQSLPLVIGLIGLLSILVLLVVRIFPIELQTEWINSGQVIQFVTVMVLLSVIMALGLAGIITENTLGTLLGGIAGYVLSQGIGRAAAREVTRGVLATQAADAAKAIKSDDAKPAGSA